MDVTQKSRDPRHILGRSAIRLCPLSQECHRRPSTQSQSSAQAFAAQRSAPGQPIHANTKGGYFLEIVIHSVRVLDELISWPYGDDYYMVILV